MRNWPNPNVKKKILDDPIVIIMEMLFNKYILICAAELAFVNGAGLLKAAPAPRFQPKEVKKSDKILLV